jgi:hypothetical protein
MVHLLDLSGSAILRTGYEAVVLVASLFPLLSCRHRAQRAENINVVGHLQFAMFDDGNEKIEKL